MVDLGILSGWCVSLLGLGLVEPHCVHHRPGHFVGEFRPLAAETGGRAPAMK